MIWKKKIEIHYKILTSEVLNSGKLESIYLCSEVNIFLRVFLEEFMSFLKRSGVSK